MTQQLTPAAAILRIVCETVIEANDVGGVDLNDLVDRLAAAGYDLPDENEPPATEQQRHTASTITDDALDALYEQLAAAERRAPFDGPCKQHPHAPRIGGLCGGCTQYPTDMTPETR
jgi:hypothetical protein